MAVDLSDLSRAVGTASAVLREHELEPHEYLRLSEDARESIRQMIRTQLDATGIPRSRRIYREQLLKFTEVGMILGIYLGRKNGAPWEE